MTPADYLTVAEIAERLKATARTVRGWCADGKIPGAYRFPDDNGMWRVRRVEFERWERGREKVGCRSTSAARPGGFDFAGADSTLDDRHERLYGV